MTAPQSGIEAPVLEARNLRLRRGARTVLEGVSLSLRAGEVVAIIGPNGAGKSTLLTALAGLRPGDGEVALEGQALASWSKARLARRVAFLPAQTSVPFPLSVHELIALAEPKPEAFRAAVRAMELEALEFVPLTRLSTGEARRAWLAMILARETRVLLLDEPLSGLDPRYQMRLLETLTARARAGACVVFVAHDLPYASRVDRVVALGAGSGSSGLGKGGAAGVVADGPPLEVLRPDLLRDLYGVDVWVGTDPESGAVFPLPIRATGPKA